MIRNLFSVFLTLVLMHPFVTGAIAADAGASLVNAKTAYQQWKVDGTATPAQKELIADYLAVRHPQEAANRDRLDYNQGPDLFGYRYVDNLNGDTATYSWIDLCGDALADSVIAGDDAARAIPIGFNFPFYGGSYDTAFISTNGLITFNSAETDFDNLCPFYNLDAFQPTIAVHWDDMVAADVGGCTASGPWIKYRNFGTYFVIEWKRLHHYNDTGDRFWFEAILFADGKIKLQYRQATAGGGRNLATSGIDAPGNGYGLEYFCNQSGWYLPNDATISRAVWFYRQATVATDLAVYALDAPSGQTPPLSTINPLANVTNAGTTAIGGTINYQFNGGAIVSENLPTLAPGTVYSHNFFTSFEAPDPDGDYPLDVWVVATEDGDGTNDHLNTLVRVKQCADWICDGPYPYTSVHRSSCDGNQCEASGTETAEQIWQINIPFDGGWTFDLCDPGTNYDSWIFLFSECCDEGESYIDDNDDTFNDCPDNQFASQLECVELTAGTYYLHIEGYDGCGGYNLHVNPCNAPPVPCDSVTSVTVLRRQGLVDGVQVTFLAPITGVYRVWRTTNKNSDNTPDEGLDPDWSMIAEFTTNPGFATVNDGPALPYAKYVVTQLCP